MGDPCKLKIIQENRFAQPQNQAGLLSHKTMLQKHETCPQAINQWWHGTHILLNELSKLLICRRCSLHTRKTLICGPSLTMSVSSVQFSCSVVSNCFRPHEPQHARPPCPLPTPGVHPNPYPLSR